MGTSREDRTDIKISVSLAEIWEKPKLRVNTDNCDTHVRSQISVAFTLIKNAIVLAKFPLSFSRVCSR